jgi:acetyl esterase/lipase
MGIGRSADIVAGRLSRLLHGIRGPRDNTLPDLPQYFDLAPGELFPTPPPLVDVEERSSITTRLSRTTTLSWQSTHEVLCPRYRTRHETEYRSNQKVWARWIKPDGKRRPDCLVYVHGWLEPGSWVEELFMFPRWTRELGVDVLHVSLPFHGLRNSPGSLFSGEHFWTADLVRSLEGIRQSIYDVRSAVGWLRRQGYARVGATGISLGGSLAMLLACLPPTPDYVVPIVAHLMLGEAVEHASILWRMKRDLERWGADMDGRREIFDRIGFDRFVPVLAPNRQLWIDAREDAHIDSELVIRQWESWGHPHIHWIPGGHMTFPLHLKEITKVMRRFLDEEVR